jgi:hypothetical protein
MVTLSDETRKQEDVPTAETFPVRVYVPGAASSPQEATFPGRSTAADTSCAKKTHPKTEKDRMSDFAKDFIPLIVSRSTRSQNTQSTHI